MTKKLLSLFIVLLGLLGWSTPVMGQDWVGEDPQPWTPYYILNVKTGKFLQGNSDNLVNWQSLPSTWNMSDEGDGTVTFACTEEPNYRLDCTLKDIYHNRFRTTQTSGASKYTLHVVNDNDHIYALSYKGIGTYYFTCDANGSIDVRSSTSIGEYNHWKFISVDEFREKTEFDFYFNISAQSSNLNYGTAEVGTWSQMKHGHLPEAEQAVTFTATATDEDHEFAYWSSDPSGVNILSRDAVYNAVLTSTARYAANPEEITLYAIFKEKTAGNSLKVVSYNIDGIPTHSPALNITINGNCPQSAGTEIMGRKLAALNADIIGVQEDFDYNADFLAGLGKDYNGETHQGAFDWNHVKASGMGTLAVDGLNMFWRIPSTRLDNESWTRWEDYYSPFFVYNSEGKVDVDSRIEKGFRSYRATVKDNNGKESYIDIFTLHMDAESTQGDIDARDNELNQLAKAVTAKGSNRPKIIMGDFNSRYTRENIKELFIDAIEEEGTLEVKDAWVETFREEEGYPTYPGHGNWESGNDINSGDYNSGTNEIVDKIFFVNPTDENCIKLDLKSFRVATDFNYPDDYSEESMRGQKIGDHYPVIADFDIIGESEEIDLSSRWIWKGETGGNGNDKQDNICYNNKTISNQTYYIHNIAANTFIQDKGISMTRDVEKAGKITFLGNDAEGYQLKHEKDADGYIFFGGNVDLETNRANTDYNGSTRYLHFAANSYNDDYKNCNVIYFDNRFIGAFTGRDAILMLTGANEGSSMTKSNNYTTKQCKTKAQANWQFISEVQKQVYLDYVSALETAQSFVKKYQPASETIKTQLENEINSTAKRWWYQTEVKDFIKLVKSLELSNMMISPKASDKLNPDPYGTFVAPYPVAIPEGVHAYKAEADPNSELVNLTYEYTGVIPARTPVLISKTGGFDETIFYDKCVTDVREPEYTWSNATLSYTSDASNLLTDGKTNEVVHNKEGQYIFQNGDLRGSLIYQPLPKAGANEDAYLLQKQGDKLAFYWCNFTTKNYTIGRSRCWLVKSKADNSNTDSSKEVKAFYFHKWDDDADAIFEVNTNATEGATEMYDLSGRRISKPQHGIYIQNGKKIFVNK